MLDKIYSLKNSKDELRAFEDKLTGTKLLVIDDLGAESSVEWVNIKVMSILAKRYDDMLPIIATTNLANDDIKGKYDVRTYDRLKAMCKVIKFEGESLR